MRLRLDEKSWQAGWEEGRSGESSKSHEELIWAGLDGWSYFSGFIEGEARRITESGSEK